MFREEKSSMKTEIQRINLLNLLRELETAPKTRNLEVACAKPVVRSTATLEVQHDGVTGRTSTVHHLVGRK